MSIEERQGPTNSKKKRRERICLLGSFCFFFLTHTHSSPLLSLLRLSLSLSLIIGALFFSSSSPPPFFFPFAMAAASVAVVGMGGVGKSALVIRFLKNEFHEVRARVRVCAFECERM